MSAGPLEMDGISLKWLNSDTLCIGICVDRKVTYMDRGAYVQTDLHTHGDMDTFNSPKSTFMQAQKYPLDSIHMSMHTHGHTGRDRCAQCTGATLAMGLAP